MEKLEKTLKKVELKGEDVTPFIERPTYQGFRLIEDKAYSRYTSIKYWM